MGRAATSHLLLNIACSLRRRAAAGLARSLVVRRPAHARRSRTRCMLRGTLLLALLGLLLPRRLAADAADDAAHPRHAMRKAIKQVLFHLYT